MGIIDTGLQFSENQAITATAFSTNSVNVTNNNTNQAQRAIRDIAPGEPVRFIAIITEAFNNLASLNFQLFNAEVDSFSGSTPPEVLVYEQEVLLVNLALGDKAVDAVIPNDLLPIPSSGRLANLFYQARFQVIGGSPPTTGQISSHFGWGSFAASHDIG